MDVVSGCGGGVGTEGRNGTEGIPVVFQGVDTAEHRHRQVAGAFEAVAILRAFVGQRIEAAERGRAAEVIPPETRRQCTDRNGVTSEDKSILVGVPEVEIRNVAVCRHARCFGRAATETERSERDPVSHRFGLGVCGGPAQAQHRHDDRETAFP